MDPEEAQRPMLASTASAETGFPVRNSATARRSGTVNTEPALRIAPVVSAVTMALGESWPMASRLGASLVVWQTAQSRVKSAAPSCAATGDAATPTRTTATTAPVTLMRSPRAPQRGPGSTMRASVMNRRHADRSWVVMTRREPVPRHTLCD